MIKNKEYNPINFIIVLYVFIGNALISNIDIFLVFLTPVILALNGFKISNNHKTQTVKTLLYLILLFCGMRAAFIGIEYFEYYFIWPIKAIIGIIIISSTKELKWSSFDTFILFIFCFFLVLLGRIENGRLISFFGPNMLYRIFGFLYAFSLFQSLEEKSNKKIIFALISIFALTSSLATGSTGAVVTIILISLAAIYRFSAKIFIASLTSLAIVLFYIETIMSYIESNINNIPTIISRTLIKLQDNSSSDRSFGLSEIYSKDPLFFGYNHSDFNLIWTDGYKYPHNIFAELYAFYGIFGIFLIMIIIFAFIRSLPQIIKGGTYELMLLVMFIASMLSGDLSDNYGVIILTSTIIMRKILTQQKIT